MSTKAKFDYMYQTIPTHNYFHKSQLKSKT